MTFGDQMVSNTALTAAAARAAHIVVDSPPHIFCDPIAEALLGHLAAELIGYHSANPTHPILAAARAQVVCRSRYAEDCLADAVRRGVGQYLVLGAGLDSFAYRAAIASEVRVFEVDHPLTQQWKRAALARARIEEPDWLKYIAVDLAHGSLATALQDGGFDFSRPAVIAWLGVTMYLTQSDIEGVLSSLGGCAVGSELIADYMLPAPLRDQAGSTYVELIAAAAAERGEPWQTFLSPADMTRLLRAHGWSPAAHLNQRGLVPAVMWDRQDALQPIELSMVVRATVGGQR